MLSTNRPKIFRRSLKINFFKIGLNACVSACCGRRRVFRSMEIFGLRRWKAAVRQFGRGRARRFGGSYAGAAAPGMIVPGGSGSGAGVGEGRYFGSDFSDRISGAGYSGLRRSGAGFPGSDIQDRAYGAQGVLRRNPRAEVSRFRRSGMVRQAVRERKSRATRLSPGL